MHLSTPKTEQEHLTKKTRNKPDIVPYSSFVQFFYEPLNEIKSQIDLCVTWGPLHLWESEWNFGHLATLIPSLPTSDRQEKANALTSAISPNGNQPTEQYASSEDCPLAAPSHVACDSWRSCNWGLVTTAACQISRGKTNVLLVSLSDS